jgi:hypothetical protein
MVAAATGLITAPSARAENLGPGWQGEFTDPAITDGYVANGAQLVVPVEFSGPPAYPIVRLSLRLTRVAGAQCPATVSYSSTVGEGDGTGATPTTPTSTPGPTAPPTTAPERGNQVQHTFRVDPGCNGTYDVAVFATGDPPGPTGPGPGSQSEDLEVDDVVVSLAPPSPSGVVAAADADRRVTVAWDVPPAWSTPDPPTDALGYQVHRVSDGGEAPVLVADGISPNQDAVVDDGLVAAPAGRYLYRVVAMRAGPGGRRLTSDPVETSLDLAAARGADPETRSGGNGTATTTGGRGTSPTVGATPFQPGQPAVSPPITEPGFDPELDYSEAELGAAEAVPPADAGLFEVDDTEARTDVLVPGAVALCLAVWAGHLRHLARRAAPPAP